MTTQAVPKQDFDARCYQKHSGVQYKLARGQLERFAFSGSESILDIGCGDGKVTALISENVPQGKVLGIDKSSAMINLAIESFPPHEIPHLSFEQHDACTFSTDERFDLITCFSCLHWIKDQRRVFENMKRHLKHNGQAVIVTFPRCRSFWDPIETIAAHPKWKGYFEDNLQPYSFLQECEYIDLIQETGLRIELIQSSSHVAKFEGKKGFENYVKGWLPFLLSLPSYHHEEFLDKIGTESLKLAPVLDDGFVCHPYEQIVIHLVLEA
jgi:trans-aconitate methyltransferase